jgi:hypothetical protein
MVCVVMWVFAFFHSTMSPLCGLPWAGVVRARVRSPLLGPHTPSGYSVGLISLFFPPYPFSSPWFLCCFSSLIYFFSGLAYGSFRMYVGVHRRYFVCIPAIWVPHVALARVLFFPFF